MGKKQEHQYLILKLIYMNFGQISALKTLGNCEDGSCPIFI